jgi:hypothetical protein
MYGSFANSKNIENRNVVKMCPLLGKDGEISGENGIEEERA